MSSTITTTELHDHLVASRLAGDVATSPASTRRNCGRMVAGDVDYTFGLSDWRTTDVDEALAAVAAHCGDTGLGRRDRDPGWIEPTLTVAQVERHRDVLRTTAELGGRTLFVTGHPTGLVGHYAALAGALAAAGCEVLTPLDDSRGVMVQDGRQLGLRFVAGVGCAWAGGDLFHTHRSGLMEAALDELDAAGRLPDLVVGDHGFAGAAIERGLRTLSIADVNDPALMVAAARGRTDAVLAIDDNLAPTLFEPVTAAMLDWAD